MKNVSRTMIPLKIGIDSEDAFRELKRLSDSATWENESLEGAVHRLRRWARYADDALRRDDVYSASACLGVVRRLLGDRQPQI